MTVTDISRARGAAPTVQQRLGRRRRSLAGLTVVGFFAIAAALPFAAAPDAFAEGSGPIRIVPLEPTPEQNTQNTQTVPATSSPASSQGAVEVTPSGEAPASNPPSGSSILENAGTDASGSDASGSITVQSLGSVGADTVGLLDPGNGGLPFRMWEGTDRDTALLLIERLPAGTASPAANELLRRLLISAAAVPGDNGVTGGNTPGGMVVARVGKLLEAGWYDDAIALIETAGGVDKIPALAKPGAKALLASFDIAGACRIAAGHSGSRDVWWQKLLVFCSAAAGNMREAQFGLSLLSESGVRDPLFFNLADRVTNGPKAKLPDGVTPDILETAMMRYADVTPDETMIGRLNKASLRIVAENAHEDRHLRLVAAEKAATGGAMFPDDLASVYKSVKFDRKDIDRALSFADEHPDAEGRALLYLAQMADNIPAAKAEVLSKLMGLFDRDGMSAIGARLLSGPVSELQPTQDLVWFAETAGRILAGSGNVTKARPWLDMLAADALRGTDSVEAVKDLWPEAAVIGPEHASSIEASGWKAWYGRLSNNRPDEAERLTSLVFGLVGSLGGDLPKEALWTMLKNDAGMVGRVTDTGTRTLLRDATVYGRIAEATALALISIGEAGTSGASPVLIEDSIGALRSSGLESDAKAIALDALLAERL